MDQKPKYRLLHHLDQEALEQGSTLLAGFLGHYRDWENFRFQHNEETRIARSVFEFVREQLTEAQRQELDAVDQFWRDNAKLFNQHLGDPLYPRDAILELLENEIELPNGNPITELPASHWWWWNIKTE